MNKTKWGIMSLMTALTLLPAQGQQTPIEELDRSRTRRERQNLLSDTQMEKAAPLSESEIEDAGPQYLLKVKERKKYFEVMADSQMLYTSNMFFEENSGEDTTLFVNTIQAALAPTAYQVGQGQLAPRIGYRHQWFNYGLFTAEDHLDSSDFSAQTVFADLRYRVDNWVWDVGLEWTRLLDQDEYAEFYKEFFPSWGLQRLIPVNPRFALGVGYTGNYRFTEADPGETKRNDRTDHALFIGGSYAITPALVFQPFYRFQYTAYVRDARNDFLNSFGLSLQYEFNEICAVRLVTSYDIRESDDNLVTDYHKFDGGAGVNVVFRF